MSEDLEKYKNYWNWRELSRNFDLILTPELLEKYQDRISASSLQRSRLWDKLLKMRPNG